METYPKGLSKCPCIAGRAGWASAIAFPTSKEFRTRLYMTTTPVPFRNESLAESLEAPRSDIPRGPADDRLRLIFARLLMLAGQWDDALSQLDAAVSLDAQALLVARKYRGLIHAEKVRAGCWQDSVHTWSDRRDQAVARTARKLPVTGAPGSHRMGSRAAQQCLRSRPRGCGLRQRRRVCIDR